MNQSDSVLKGVLLAALGLVCSAATAKTVRFKNLGPVPLDSFSLG